MAASGFTPISLYYSTTAAAAPTSGNLVNGELAINITDGKLYYKDNAGVVKVLAGAGGAGIAGGSNTQVQYNSSGSLAGSSNFVWDNANGRLGVGTASPAKLLDLSANNTGITTGDPANILRFTDSDTTSAADQPFGRIEWYSADADGAGVKAYIQGQSQDGSPDGNIVFATHTVSGGGLAERMRIDYAGNVGIGTSSPTTKLDVNGGVGVNGVLGISSGNGIYLDLATTANGYIGRTDRAYMRFDRADFAGFLSFYTTPSGSPSIAERMRIDSAGNVGIGTAAPTDKLEVVNSGTTNTYAVIKNGTITSYAGVSGSSNGLIGTFTNHPFTFLTNNTERMRITSAGGISFGSSGTAYGTSGQVLTSQGNAAPIWTTPTTGTVTSVGGTGSINGLSLSGTVTTTGNLTLGGSITSVSTSGNFQMNSLGVGTAGSATAGEIRATNNITAYYSSDRKLKENIQDVDNALDKVCSIGSKTFDWTDEYIAAHGGEDAYFMQKSDFGVIAQDVQSVFPQAVRTREDGTLAVDYEKLSTLAFGAIKELVKRVEVLENK
jgi:hypothetical protein